jgi:phosphate-selective porin OprO/OprP
MCDDEQRVKKEVNMSKKLTTMVSALVLVALAAAVQAGGVKYKNEDGDYLKLGGRIQFQYHRTDVDGGETTDELKFRRLRPYIEGSVNEDWKGKWQFDLGKGSVEIKDAYFAYKGIDGMQVAIGNANFPFSREFLTSSKKQQLVERTYVGDHNYGTPDRQAGLHVTGGALDNLVTYGASATVAAHDPSNKKLDFDSVASLNRGDDWSEGPMVGGRVDVHPFGMLKMEQGDFKGDLKATIGVGAFTWANDDDIVNMETDDDTGVTTQADSDLDSATGFEVSAAVRVAGLSVDAQYNTFDADLVVGGVTDGIYVDSATTLESYAVEGGFMVLPERLELVAGYQSQDADGYAKSWNKTSVGANYFVKKHDIKYQVTYQMGENKDGKDGSDVDELFVQAQYVF